MADIILTQGESLPTGMQVRYRDMGDGTHALVVFDAASQGGYPGSFSSLTVGDVNNYTQVDEDGFLQTFGSGRGYYDFNFGVNAFTRGAAAPDLIDLAGTDIETAGFDGVNITEELSAVLEFNHNWAEGTTIYPHVHWYPTTADQGNVVWQLEFAIVAQLGAVPASTTVTVTQAADGVAWVGHLAQFPSVDTTGFLIGTQMFIRLFRDPTVGADTYGADAALATFGLHVLLDSLGSRGLLVK
jgi:hypothetical protein